MKIETVPADFTDEQKRNMEGFTTGLQINRLGHALGAGDSRLIDEPTGADATHIKAKDNAIASDKKLTDKESFKRDQLPFNAYPRRKQQQLENALPSNADN